MYIYYIYTVPAKSHDENIYIYVRKYNKQVYCKHNVIIVFNDAGNVSKKNSKNKLITTTYMQEDTNDNDDTNKHIIKTALSMTALVYVTTDVHDNMCV